MGKAIIGKLPSCCKWYFKELLRRRLSFSVGTTEQGNAIRVQLCNLLKKIGINIRKCRTNNAEHRKLIPEESLELSDLSLPKLLESSHALGIQTLYMKNWQHEQRAMWLNGKYRILQSKCTTNLICSHLHSFKQDNFEWDLETQTGLCILNFVMNLLVKLSIKLSSISKVEKEFHKYIQTKAAILYEQNQIL